MEEAKKEALMNCSSLDELLNIEFGEVGTPSREVFDKETEAFCLAQTLKEERKRAGLTQQELADRIGKSRPAIANTLRLLSLAQEVIKMVSEGQLSAGHARSLVSVPHVDQIKIAQTAVKEGLSVREVEKRVKDYFDPPELKEKKRVKVELSAELKDLISQMQRTFGTKVNAIGNDKKGRIYIDYYTRDDLDRLAEIVEFVDKNKK